MGVTRNTSNRFTEYLSLSAGRRRCQPSSQNVNKLYVIRYYAERMFGCKKCYLKIDFPTVTFLYCTHSRKNIHPRSIENVSFTFQKFIAQVLPLFQYTPKFSTSTLGAKRVRFGKILRYFSLMISQKGKEKNHIKNMKIKFEYIFSAWTRIEWEFRGRGEWEWEWDLSSTETWTSYGSCCRCLWSCRW